MFRSDKAGHLCLLLLEVPSNFAKGNRLMNSAQEIMVSGVLLKLLTLIFLSCYTFASEKEMFRKLLKSS